MLCPPCRCCRRSRRHRCRLENALAGLSARACRRRPLFSRQAQDLAPCSLFFPVAEGFAPTHNQKSSTCFFFRLLFFFSTFFPIDRERERGGRESGLPAPSAFSHPTPTKKKARNHSILAFRCRAAAATPSLAGVGWGFKSTKRDERERKKKRQE